MNEIIYPRWVHHPEKDSKLVETEEEAKKYYKDGYHPWPIPEFKGEYETEPEIKEIIFENMPEESIAEIHLKIKILQDQLQKLINKLPEDKEDKKKLGRPKKGV
ncbi:MAG: hypothetical protein ABSC54_11835 [Smithellaceae bacterium]|jgi:hypothetical protein